MTTVILDTEIVYRRDTKDYDILICGQFVGSAAIYSDAEAIRTQALSERRDEGHYAGASELDADNDPFGDPRTNEEKRWETEGWTEVEGGWETFGPHPFDPSKTVRHFRARLFNADPTPLPEPDDIPGADPSPERCPACQDLGPCWECGSIDLPAIGRALRHEMHDDRPALLRRLRATPERWHRLLAHAYVLEIGHTPSCDAQPAVPGVLWLWRELLRTAA